VLRKRKGYLANRALSSFLILRATSPRQPEALARSRPQYPRQTLLQGMVLHEEAYSNQ
jgi:hypothetical protein